MYRSNWLGLAEWGAQGMPILSTTSEEAAKLYDAALTQFAGWYDDPLLGGLTHTLAKLNQADPYFILGNAFSLCMQLVGFTVSYHCNNDLRVKIDELEQNSEQRKNEITLREYKHAQAAVRMSKLDWEGAAQLWDDVLTEFPTDLHALKMAFYMYFFTGQREKQFQSMNRVFPYFQKGNTVNANLADGMLAFVYEEVGKYSEAEMYARLGLAKNPCDGWTTHALAHVYESTGRFSEGLAFLGNSSQLWSRSNLLACHNFWHQSLFNIATGNLDEAIHLLDNEILPRVRTNQTSFAICDASSLLYRLALVDSSKRDFTVSSLDSRFGDVFAVTKQYLNKHILPFNDVHFMMACLGSGHTAEASELIDSLKESHFAEIHPAMTKITVQLMNSIAYYQEENFEKATDVLCSIKDSIVQIGGSNAQRNIFDQFLLVSSLKSSKPEHKKLLNQLTLMQHYET